MSQTEFSLAELIVTATSEAWRNNGEVLASGAGGPLTRLGASLAKMTHSPELLMTDSEAYLVEEPIPLGPRGDYKPKFSGALPFSRVFDCVWRGKRHAMTGPVQIDRWGQTNLSCIGDFRHPKIQQLGVRGLPGNTINHMNSMWVANHSTRVFVEGEVDMVGGVGYNQKRWPAHVKQDYVDLRLIVTNLCVLDFEGPDHAIQVRSLHPGVTFEEVQAATGFPLLKSPSMKETAHPTEEQLAIIRRLDPHNIRAAMLKDNPPGIRAAA
jgi:glutaconate CoA-transferase subunit B